MPTKRSILDYQQRCFADYATNISLPEDYRYPDGNPIRPLPPVKVALNNLMIVGAYPSARFESRESPTDSKRRRLIPIADNLQPFGDEQYFDGIRTRDLESTVGLVKYLLSPLGLIPDDCWVTDLVKVFLYKPGHESSCGEVVPEFQVPVLRGKFKDLGTRSLPWLQDEIKLCKPNLIVTLGQEVAQVVSGELSATADDLLAREVSNPDALLNFPAIYLPHPDACRRSDKWRGIMKGRIEFVASALG